MKIQHKNKTYDFRINVVPFSVIFTFRISGHIVKVDGIPNMEIDRLNKQIPSCKSKDIKIIRIIAKAILSNKPFYDCTKEEQLNYFGEKYANT